MWQVRQLVAIQSEPARSHLAYRRIELQKHIQKRHSLGQPEQWRRVERARFSGAVASTRTAECERARKHARAEKRSHSLVAEEESARVQLASVEARLFVVTVVRLGVGGSGDGI